MNGMALHGGVIPACGTFFVFSDYMKPAIRMSALMRLRVIYIWSHDSFRVGEDGPTHQPIEHETQIRLMEHVHNHQGERSMVVLRPADAEETVAAWQYIMGEKRPVALILSRQNIKTLPALSCSRREEAKQAVKGAYIVADSAKAQVVMLASGSEVSTLIEGAELLRKDGIAVRVVSVPSEGLFRDQPKSYQDSVLPKDVMRYGLTSGLSLNLSGLVGENGKIHGCNHFGYSAPFKVLDEKFGYNGQTVYEEVKAMIKG
jgi:transketolase